jgi:LacI family transcriptional regulator
MVAAVERAASNNGKSVLVASTHGDAARERDVVVQMLSRRVSGMLLAPTAGDHAWLRTNTPLVLVDRAAPGLEADVVGIDDEAATADAVNHLVAHGHRRIAYVSDHPLVPTSRARLAGYRRAMAAHGLDTGPQLVRAECPDPLSAAEATRNLLAGNVPPTALLSAATRCSLGVVPTLHALGRTDIALVCFGDFAMADLLRPGVTVVDHSAEAVGEAAATRLAERIAQPDLPVSTLHVPVRLIPRGSGELRP